MIYLFLAEGFEEVEAITPLDYLRRCNLEVCCVGVGQKKVKGSHGICVEADEILDSCNFKLEKSLVILPGGLLGTENLNSNETVKNILLKVSSVGSVGAICAAPLILGQLKLLDGKRACCYPGFEHYLIGADVVDEKVVVCENILTSQGAGTAQHFAFELVKYVCGSATCGQLKKSVKWS